MRVNRKELLEALVIAGKVVPAKTNMPILSTVRIEKGNLLGTDLEIGVQVPLNGEWEENEPIYQVNAQRLASILKSMDEDVVSLSYGEDGEKVHVGDNWEILGMDPDDFPDFPMPEKAETPLEVSTESILSVQSAAARKFDRGFMLTGIYFDGHHGKIVATDGHRLHMAQGPEFPGAMFLPLAATKALLAGKNASILLTPEFPEAVQPESIDPDILTGLTKKQLISLNEDYFGFEELPDKVGEIRELFMAEMQSKIKPVPTRVDKVRIDTTGKAVFGIRTMDVRFPDYHAVLPKLETTQFVKVKKSAFHGALDQALTMSDSKYKAVKITANGNGIMEMLSTNPEVGQYERTNLEMQGSVDPVFEHGFNPAFLIEASAAIQTDDLEIGLSSSGMMSFSTENFKALVMPMRI